MKRSLVRSIAMAATLGGAGALWVACTGTETTTGGTMPGGGTDVTEATGVDTKYVVNEIALPKSRAEFAIDLNGDGTKDNQLGNIIGAIISQGLDAQKGVADSLAQGDVILLITVKSEDLTKTDDTAGATFHIGMKKDMPDFSGAGMFTVDTSQTAANFLGKINAGKFSSNNPVTTQTPTAITLKLSLVAGAEPLTLSVNGAHASFTASANGLMSGELHGSIKNADIQTGIIPAVASLLSKQVADNPTSSSSMQILTIFDTGGTDGMCKSPNGMTSAKEDGKIDVCEVAENSIIMNVLAPDIQVYKDGKYAPQKMKVPADLDSLSLGLSFNAVKATF